MKPVLFNTPMVLALLDNRKTATRRVVKPLPPRNARLELVGDKRHAMDISIEIPGPDDHRIYTPPYLPGDILYVRESWQRIESGRYIYRADNTNRGSAAYYNEHARLNGGWRPSIHMPKEAARIFLRVTDVRVERLQDITEEGARSEGIRECFIGMGESGFAVSPYSFSFYGNARGAFADLWNSTIPKHPNKFKSYPYRWKDNPWVWVIEFERCEKPEEESAKC